MCAHLHVTRLPVAVGWIPRDEEFSCTTPKNPPQGGGAVDSLTHKHQTYSEGSQNNRRGHRRFNRRQIPLHTNAPFSLTPTLTQIQPKQTAFDLFLVDDRILPLLGKALGKIFFAKKKQPVPLKLGALLKGPNPDPTAVGKRIVAARERTYLYRNHGNCVSVRVARTTMGPQQVGGWVVCGWVGGRQVMTPSSSTYRPTTIGRENDP